MNCKRVQELLLTDYTDGRLDVEEKAKIDKHLEACPGCKAYRSLLVQNVNELFKGSLDVEAPEYLWHRIKRQISSEGDGKKPWRTWRGFDIFKFIPRPALIMAILMVFVLANIVTVRYVFAPKHQVKAGEILNYLEDISDFGADSPGLGTDMESLL